MSKRAKKTSETPIIHKIEVDEKTSEPILVEVPITELPDETEVQTEEDPLTVNAIKLGQEFEKKNNKEIGKQIVMTKIMGITKESNFISKRQKLFKNIFTIVFVVFVVAVLVFTFYKDFFASGEEREFPSWNDILNIFSTCWYYLVYAILALGCCILFKGLKLSIMCKSLTDKAHFRTCVETGIIGLYYNNVTPLAVGGQPFEIYHLTKHGVHGGVASSLPIATFFLNQLAFVILGVLAIVLFKFNALGIPEYFMASFSGVSSVFTTMAIIGCVTCIIMPGLVVLFSFLPKTGATIVHFVMWLGGKLRLLKKPKETAYRTMKTVVQNAKCLKKVTTRPVVFISTFFLSFLEQLANSSIAFFTLKAFGFDIIEVNAFSEWLMIIQLSLILYASISFIPTPGNSGAADLSFYLLFETGLYAGLAFPAMMVWRFLSFYSFILIGFVFVTIKKKYDGKKNLQTQMIE